MRKLVLWIVAFAASSGALFAQNITGSWQGTLPGPQGKPGLRIVFKISRADDEKLSAVLYSIDQGGQPLNASSVSQQGSTLKLAIAIIGGSYEGKMSADGNSIAGNWSQGGPQALPLNLVRATPDIAWAIPEPPAPRKKMAADAKPVFDVATIKPSPPDAKGASILVGRGGTNLFTTTNSTLKDLIIFAYGLHPRQVSGGPSWIETDRFDITAKPDQAGDPSMTQLQDMVQKLLKERFQLAFHREKKELSVYAITVAKTGSKLAKTQTGGNLPGFGGSPRGMVVQNSNMADFASFLQSRVVDRPVVDQTGLPDRYDFTFKFQPDVAQPGAPPPAADAEPLPDLFTAFQQQLGLKLEATKAPVEVLVIDKLEKPSEN